LIIKKVLYISYDGMTDQLGQSQVIPYLIGLSDKGFSIYLLSFEKKQFFVSQGKEVNELLKSNNINWIPKIYTAKPKIISTIYDIIKILFIARQLHKKYNFDLVHCRSYIASFGGVALKKKKVKFIFDMRGFWADERVDGKIWNTKNILFKAIYNFFKKKEKTYLNKADYIISLTHAGKKIINDNTNLGYNDKIEVIPCCADLELFNSENITLIQRKTIKEKMGIKDDDFVLSYLGSVGTWYMLPEMMLFYKCLLEYKSEAKFLFITRDDPSVIYREAEKLNLNKSLIIIKEAKRNEVPLFLSLSNFSLFFILPVFSKKASSPTKFGEIMGMGIPVVCNSGIGDTDMFMKDENLGVMIDGFSIDEMKKAAEIITTKKYNPEIIKNTAKKFFSLETGIDLYESVYRKLII